MPGSAQEDPVALAIEHANRLLDSSPNYTDVAGLVEQLEALSPRDLARFDWQARSWYSGINWHAVGKLRWPFLRGARKGLWETLALVSGDGHERERAARDVPANSFTAKLLVLRCLDWVSQVRSAALARVDELPHDLLVEALPLAEQLADERERAELLDALLDARLQDNDLRLAARADDVLLRRAAWRRLRSRDAATADELIEVAAKDSDVLVRAVAAKALPTLPAADRRRLADVLLADRVGWVAVPALGALVDLDGESVIRSALLARTAPVRRAAQGWSTVCGIDARSFYVERLAADGADPLTLQALADLADPRDVEVFRRMLREPRSRLSAAGLRALARVQPTEARAAALDALRGGATGRVTWAAADVLREGAPSAAEARALADLALDDQRTAGQRFRILSILRPAKWLHLHTLLVALRAASDEDVRWRLTMEVDAWIGQSNRIARRPDESLQQQIETELAQLDKRRRERIEFVLRTSA